MKTCIRLKNFGWLDRCITDIIVDIKEGDLFELFGLLTTNYLRDNSEVQMPLSKNTGKRRDFAYINKLKDVSVELFRLHGIKAPMELIKIYVHIPSPHN